MVRRLRLASGLVLFAFLVTHYLNHALGLISLAALEAGSVVFVAVWRSPPGTVLLYGALILHAGLAFWSLYQRRSLRMPAWEAAQLVLGLAIPPLLAIHLLGTRGAQELFGTNDSYAFVLLIYFHFNPLSGLRQAIVMVVAWAHAMVGLHFWLRLKPWYPRLQPYALVAAVLLPVLAGLGVVEAGRDLALRAVDPVWLADTLAAFNAPDEEKIASLYAANDGFIIGYFVLLAGVLAARLLRDWLRRRSLVKVTYGDGRRAEITPGMTVLEASRASGIPHASVCGGRGRCSTCRVRVGQGVDHLPPASEAERKVLARVGAAPNVRLACQLRPRSDLEVTPLLQPSSGPQQAGRPGYLQGEERELAILFADLRGFTSISERKLPYDVVFLLNRYFAVMGAAVEQAGGRIDKFVGDGVMALFGVEADPELACRQALTAARSMSEQLAEINRALGHELDRPLRMGIGIHKGAVIVGEMGYGRVAHVTAIGDAVNTASRLEALTKELTVELILSEPVAESAGFDLGDFPQREVELRGRNARLAVRLVADAKQLP